MLPVLWKPTSKRLYTRNLHTKYLTHIPSTPLSSIAWRLFQKDGRVVRESSYTKMWSCKVCHFPVPASENSCYQKVADNFFEFTQLPAFGDEKIVPILSSPRVNVIYIYFSNIFLQNFFPQRIPFWQRWSTFSCFRAKKSNHYLQFVAAVLF